FDDGFFTDLLGLAVGSKLVETIPSPIVKSCTYIGLGGSGDEVEVIMDKDNVKATDVLLVSVNAWVHSDSGTFDVGTTFSSGCMFGTPTGTERVPYNPQVPNESVCGQLLTQNDYAYSGTKSKFEALATCLIKITDATVDPRLKVSLRFRGGLNSGSHTGINSGIRISVVPLTSSLTIR
ncbi:hypothetical protein N9W60_06155, partial [Flavobacteriaceae bacterium]|nr:hypothetical protein [Flavobacteriaceae bacterium]